MSITDEIARLHELRTQGALSAAEFEQAKARLLAGDSGGNFGQDGGFGPDRGVAMYAELDRLDRDWQRERSRYLVYSRQRGHVIPTVLGSLIGGGMLIIGGVVWIIVVFSSQAARFMPSYFPWISGLFVLIGLVKGGFGVMRANRYQQAERAYQQRRAEILARYGAPGVQPVAAYAPYH